ncbi:MAG: bifunctional 4-hydroxy-2-oxoglutarate aldolase/2-dehydro-3-deoxy-phosphogluconate aldolase [Pseudomonadota bacterium]
MITIKNRVIPVITINDLDDAVPLARTLVQAGLVSLEITLRTDCALAAITAMREALPDAIIGAGTVRTAHDVLAAIDAGAQFLVTPGTTPALLEALQKTKEALLILPGCATLSEAMRLYDHGFSSLKFFPAMAMGGIATLKSFAGPMPDIQFCPTGGITQENAAEFLALANVSHIGGSWMLPNDALKAKHWPTIHALAEQAAHL